MPPKRPLEDEKSVETTGSAANNNTNTAKVGTIPAEPSVNEEPDHKKPRVDASTSGGTTHTHDAGGSSTIKDAACGSTSTNNGASPSTLAVADAPALTYTHFGKKGKERPEPEELWGGLESMWRHVPALISKWQESLKAEHRPQLRQMREHVRILELQGDVVRRHKKAVETAAKAQKEVAVAWLRVQKIKEKVKRLEKALEDAEKLVAARAADSKKVRPGQVNELKSANVTWKKKNVQARKMYNRKVMAAELTEKKVAQAVALAASAAQHTSWLKELCQSLRLTRGNGEVVQVDLSQL